MSGPPENGRGMLRSVANTREAIAAMKSDRNSDLIALIMQDIIGHADDGAATDGRRIQSAIVQGFLAPISKSFAAAS
jgi:hypothetical protein